MSDDRNNGQTAGDRDELGRFLAGNSGRPRGARHRITRAVEDLLDGEAEKLTRKAVDLALAGDTTALRLCIERIAPAIRSRTIELELPDLNSPADTLNALAAIVRATAAGEVDLESAQSLAGLIDTHRKGLELVDIDARLKRLEEAQAKR